MPEPTPRPDDPSDVLAGHFLRGLRIASAAIALSVLGGLALPEQLMSGWARSVPSLLALTAVAAAGLVLAVRGRGWGAARWPVAGLALLVVAADVALMPPALLTTPAHQSLTAVGWIWVLLFIDVAFAPILALVAVNHVGTLLLLLTVGRSDQETLTNYLTSSIAIIGFQVVLAAAASALRRVAANATAAAVRRSQLLTAESVAQQVHADRDRRYGELRSTVLPLLRALADGTARPSDPDVQRRAAQEAARLRRLFAEADDVAEPLRGELAAVVTVAERRGLVVQQAFLGRRPSPPVQARRILLDAVAEVLLRAAGTARVTVAGGTGTLTVSVVARAPGTAAGSREVDGIEISSVVEGGQAWTQARWTAPVPAS